MKKNIIIATGLGALTTLIIGGTLVWKKYHKNKTEEESKKS